MTFLMIRIFFTFILFINCTVSTKHCQSHPIHSFSYVRNFFDFVRKFGRMSGKFPKYDHDKVKVTHPSIIFHLYTAEKKDQIKSSPQPGDRFSPFNMLYTPHLFSVFRYCRGVIPITSRNAFANLLPLQYPCSIATVSTLSLVSRSIRAADRIFSPRT